MKKIVYFGVFFIAASIVVLFYLINPHQSLPITPLAVQGVFDLSDWQLKKNKSLNLNGEWAFYWKQLITPTQFLQDNEKQTRSWMQIPQIWNEFKYRDKAVGPYGYATFRVKITKPSTDEKLALKIRKMESSYRLWIDDQEVAKNGLVGKTADSSIPYWKNTIVVFDIPNDSVDITLQISNFSYKRGGFRYPIKIGTVSQIYSIRDRALLLDYVLIGSLLIMGFYHFALYFYRRKDKSTLYLGLFCIITIVRISVMGEHILTDYIPLSWELNLRLEYLSFYLLGPIFLAFFHSLFPEETKKRLVYNIIYMGIGLSIIVVFTPASFYTKTLLVNQLIALVTGSYISYALYHAVINKREGVYLFIGGWGALFLFSINDMLHANQIIFTGFLMPVGLFILIFSQSVILSKRFNKAFSIAEVLTKELEKQVSERTKELSTINNQQKELLHVLCHDLSTPFANIKGALQYSEVKKDFFEKARDLLMNSTENGLELINLIREISALEEGKYQVKLVQFRLCDLISKSLSILTQRLNEKNISIVHSIDETLTVRVERVSFVNSVFNNLLSNAIKFSNPGSKIDIKAFTNNNRTVLIIMDHGIGMPAKILNQLFDMTKATNRPGTQRETGTGFGMPLIKKFVEAYGGTIQVESKDIDEHPGDHGTKIKISLDS